MIKLLSVFFFMILFLSKTGAQEVTGVVKDNQGLPIPGVNVVIKNTYTGTVADENGHWKIAARPGKYTLVFSIMGYSTQEKEVVVKAGGANVETILSQSVTQLNEALIVADTRDLAKEIMQEVRRKRKQYADGITDYTCGVYRKLSLLRVEPKSLRDSLMKASTDSLMEAAGAQLLTPKQKREARKNARIKRRLAKHQQSMVPDSLRQMADTVRVRYIGDLNEIVLGQVVYGGQYLESVKAENTYDPSPPNNYIYISMGYDEEGLEVDRIQYIFESPYMVFNDAADWEFNFYKPLLKKEMICMQPLVSPLSPSGPTLYRYDYAGLIYDDSTKVFRIKVTPIFPNDALFNGYMYIRDHSFTLYELDFTINESALDMVNSFRIRQKYVLMDSVRSVPMSTIIEYSIKEGRTEMTISGTSYYNDYRFEVDSTGFKKHSLEQKKYDADALVRDSAWWASSRPLPLSDLELKYSHHIDSLRNLFSSEAFLHRMDSAYNRIDVWSFLVKGFMHRDRKHQIQYYINPLSAQMNFFGIGGYRHMLGANFNKRFSNDFLLESEVEASYGFNNHDLRGRYGLGLTYVPKRFVRTFVRFGDFYDMINTNPSITSAFSRGNYARTKMFSVAQRMEIVNGLFGELTFEHSDQQAIDNMQMDSWSNQLFGSVNQPLDFDRYVKTEFKLNLVYRIRQRYMFKGNRKILMGSDWPDIKFTWRKGIPGLLGSEVNFDYLEIGAGDYVRLNRYGISNWSFMMGSYVNRDNLRILEHKYFRGSDKFFFSNPLESFQLLGPTLNTSSAFIRGNYIHHLEGAFLNKIPLISRLKLSLAAGGGFLFMEENHFRHGEFFAGIEKPIRIRREMFRIGLYAVTSDNNINRADFTFKIGISMYNSYLKKWDY